MYLTEMILWDEAAARLMPRDSYGWHKIIWRFFPGKEKRDYLYRTDHTPSGVRVLILSDDEPVQLDKMQGQIIRTRKVPESFLSHKRYRFQLRANPTQKLKIDKRDGQKKANGLRAPIVNEQELAAWLARKAESGGFSIPGIENWPSEHCNLTIVPEGRQEFKKKGLSAAHHTSVQFTGILEVTDEHLFRETFRKGIGTAKAFGFGLLMLQNI